MVNAHHGRAQHWCLGMGAVGYCGYGRAAVAHMDPWMVPVLCCLRVCVFKCYVLMGSGRLQVATGIAKACNYLNVWSHAFVDNRPKIPRLNKCKRL